MSTALSYRAQAHVRTLLSHVKDPVRSKDDFLSRVRGRFFDPRTNDNEELSFEDFEYRKHFNVVSVHGNILIASTKDHYCKTQYGCYLFIEEPEYIGLFALVIFKTKKACEKWVQKGMEHGQTTS